MTALHHSKTTGMAYRDEGQGPPILLIHGWGVSGDLFEQQITGLSSRFRMVVPDLPGHAASPALAADEPFAHLADSIASLIHELHLPRLCVVGWSMGAMVAWDLVLRYPQLGIAALVSIDMVPSLLNRPGWQHGLRDGDDARLFQRNIQRMRSDWLAYTNLFVPRIFSARAGLDTAQQVERTTQVALANDPESMANNWMRMATLDFRLRLSDIAIPTLVMAGAHSQLYTVAAAEWVCQQLPNARLEVFSDSGHAPHIEETEKFNRILAGFADQCLRTVASANRSAQAGTEPS